MNEVIPSLSDIAAVTNANRNNSGFGFGGDGAWIVLLLLLAWGNNGNGWFGGSSNSGAADNYVLASDFATLQRQIDSATTSLENKGDRIQEQICNSDQMNSQMFANLNTNLLTNAATLNNTLAANFATTNSNLMNGFANVNQGISANRYENQLAMNTISSQIANCCCENRVQNLENTNALQTSLAGINYNMATNTNGIQNAISSGFCDTNYNNANNTRNIIDSVNAGFRNLHDEILANRIADKDAQIDMLTSQLNNANLAASQARQTSQIINALEPKVPQAAYVVPNPFTGCGCNNGCGNYNF